MRQQALIDLPPHDPRSFEHTLHLQGISIIAGVDEAGRGCLAGPVVAAAAILPLEFDLPDLKDSKQLTEKKRDELYDAIRACALSTSVGVVSSQEIDRINILEATFAAMRAAIDGLTVRPEYLLIDGPMGINYPVPQKPIKKGDALSVSISAASIIAKVTRDRMMCELEREYPNFRFSIHKGYGTELHLDELRRHGPTAVHRKTFRGVI